MRPLVLVLSLCAVVLGLAAPASADEEPVAPALAAAPVADAAPPVDAAAADAPVDAAEGAAAPAPGDASRAEAPVPPAPVAPSRAAADVDERLQDLPPPSIGLGELVGPLAKTLLMLGVVLVIVYLTLHKGLGKLVERQNLGKRVKVVERVALDQRRTLFVVEVDGKQMLLGAGEGGVVHLKDLGDTPASERVAAPPGASGGTSGGKSGEGGGFGARFAEALKSRAGAPPPVTTGLPKDLSSDVAADLAADLTDVADMKKA